MFWNAVSPSMLMSDSYKAWEHEYSQGFWEQHSSGEGAGLYTGEIKTNSIIPYTCHFDNMCNML